MCVYLGREDLWVSGLHHSCLQYASVFFFLGRKHAIWHVGSEFLTKDWTHTPCIGRAESSLDHQESPWRYFLLAQVTSPEGHSSVSCLDGIILITRVLRAEWGSRSPMCYHSTCRLNVLFSGQNPYPLSGETESGINLGSTSLENKLLVFFLGWGNSTVLGWEGNWGSQSFLPSSSTHLPVWGFTFIHWLSYFWACPRCRFTLAFLVSWIHSAICLVTSEIELESVLDITQRFLLFAEIMFYKVPPNSKKQDSSRKTSISALLTMPKPLTVWITINCGNFWKRWEYQTTWPASWETCMQVRKQQLELDMEKQTGSK